MRFNVRSVRAAAPRKTFIPSSLSDEPIQPPPPPEEKPTDQSTSQLTEEQALQTESIKERKEISLLFPNITSLEKSEAAKMIDEQIVYYKSQSGYQKLIENILRFKNIVSESSRSLGFKENSSIPSLLLSAIYVESGGDPSASASINEDAARGLCQIKPSTARPIAKRLGMKIPPNLFDPWTNITLSLEHFDRLFSLFPDPSLAFWAYHLGEGNMVEAIEEYVVREKWANRRVVQLIFNFPGGGGSASLVKEYDLNFVKLITSKHVVARLKEIRAFGDETNLYVPRVGAATSLLNT